MHDFLTGFAQVKITPPLGTELFGHGFYPERYATAVLDPLFVRAMAWRMGDESGVLVCCEVLCIFAESTARIRESLYKKLCLLPRNVMICCQHNHAGPATGELVAHGEVDSSYLSFFEASIIEAAEQAFTCMQPSTLEYGSLPVADMGHNREYDPKVIDPLVRMVTVSSNGKVRGVLVNHSCHPVVINMGTFVISSDFMGRAMQRLSQQYGVTAMIIQGSCGDINSAFVNNPQELAIPQLEILSDRFYRYVDELYSALKEPIAVEDVKTVLRKISFPLVPMDRFLVLRYIRLTDALLAGELHGDIRKEVLCENVMLKKLWARYDQPNADVLATEMQAFRFGELTIVSQPGEMFFEIQQALESRMTAGKTILAGYANDFVGYIPLPDRYDVSGGHYSYPAYQVPFLLGHFPFEASISNDYADEMLCTYLAIQSKGEDNNRHE